MTKNLATAASAATNTSSKSMWYKVLGGLVVAGALGLTGTLLVNALFTDTATIPGDTFASGTVDIATTPEGSAAIGYANMAPGDLKTAGILVANSGTLGLRYSVTSTTSPSGLDADLKTWIRQGTTANLATCVDGMTDAAFKAWGTADVYGGSVLIDAAGAGGAAVGSAAGVKVIGDVATGQTAATGSAGTANFVGADRPLTAATSESLCVRVLLPLATAGVGPAGGSQGKTTTATFLFSAEQTKNN